MKIRSQIVTVSMAVILLGSVVVGTNLVLQKASAIVGEQEFKNLTKKFKQDVLNLVSTNPPEPDREKQLATLFNNYEQETFKKFGLTPPFIQAPPAIRNK
jgi:hypothetical protein